MKQIQLAKKSTFSAVRRYVTAQFSTISDSYAPIPTPGVPQNAEKPIPTHRPRSPLPAGRKKIWGEKCPHDENFGGGGPRGPHPAQAMFCHLIGLLPTVGSTPILPFRKWRFPCIIASWDFEILVVKKTCLEYRPPGNPRNFFTRLNLGTRNISLQTTYKSVQYWSQRRSSYLAP